MQLIGQKIEYLHLRANKKSKALLILTKKNEICG